MTLRHTHPLATPPGGNAALTGSIASSPSCRGGTREAVT